MNRCYNKITKNKESRKAHTKGKVYTMTKMTYVSALEIAINAVADVEVVEKLQALKAQIEKKNSADRKPTKTQVANDALRGQIVDLLGSGVEPMTAGEIADKFGVSNQKVTALMSKLLEDGAVVREVIKRKAYFKVA